MKLIGSVLVKLCLLLDGDWSIEGWSVVMDTRLNVFLLGETDPLAVGKTGGEGKTKSSLEAD